MTYDEVFARAAAENLVLNNMYQLRDGAFRCNWKTRWFDDNGREYCWFSHFADSVSPLEALTLSLDLAISTQPHDAPEPAADDDPMGLFA
jgi:hypothetical protein